MRRVMPSNEESGARPEELTLHCLDESLDYLPHWFGQAYLNHYPPHDSKPSPNSKKKTDILGLIHCISQPERSWAVSLSSRSLGTLVSGFIIFSRLHGFVASTR